MLKYISSFFWDDVGTDLSLDEAYNVLDNAREEPDEKHTQNEDSSVSVTEYTCYHRTGFITSAKNGCYIIDDLYEFQSNISNLAVGMEVSFVIYDSNGSFKVSNIAIVDDWFSQPTNSKSSWCIRSAVCKISKREGRSVFITPGEISIDLNDVASEFIPIVGDWVDVESKVELDENVTDLFGKILEIRKIRPLRPHIVEGKIKVWCPKSKTGCINRSVYFNQDALAAGYIPVIGDKVVTEVIESDQGVYNWRALKVLSEEKNFSKPVFNSLTKAEFEKESSCIYVSNDINIDCKRIGEKIHFTFDVINKSDDFVTLISVSFESNTTQCIFQKPELLTNIKLMPNENKRVEGICRARNVGISKELVLFTFSTCKIGRWITISIEIDQTSYDKHKYAHRSSLLLPAVKFRQDYSMIRGQPLIARPRFISARLPEYPVPQKLLDVVVKYQNCQASTELLQELRSIKPCLNLPLSYNIYEERFHTLLHLEEIFEILARRSYACDLTCFVRNGEYLMLEIENLSERRPSLIVGDRIIAKDPYNDDSAEFEGFIHKLGAKHAYIKFAPSYHDTYNGEDVSIIAVASRSTYRRMHQAVGLAVRNLGNSFLFASKIEAKKPQISFYYDKYFDELKQPNDKIRDQARQSEEHNLNQTTCDTNDNKEYNTHVKSKLLLDIPDISKSKQKYEADVRKSPLNTLKLEWYNKNLNYYQKEAVRNILLGEARPLPYIIFGPPGTGKTVTLVETILQILQHDPYSRLLVGTPSNSAADLIALRLIDSGLIKPGDLIRLVAYRCVVDDMLPLKLIPYCATAEMSKEGTKEYMFTAADNGLTLGCSSSVIGRHRITVGTCSGLGVLFNMDFSKGHFSHIIVDEAGQTTEPNILIPLAFLDIFSGQVILAGDPQQLGPVVNSSASIAYGLDETFLDRMLSRFPYARDLQGFPESGGYDPRLVTKLIYNYRSLPEILKLTSDLFYGGDLINTISPIESKEADLLKQVREILPVRENPLPPSVIFHSVLGENYQTADCPSWFNPDEASQIFYYVNELYRLGLKSTDIGIISPYIKQVRQIRALLVEAEFEVPKVGTVEEFQGQEFPVILLSTVRSNRNLVEYDMNYKLGFISIPTRVNVAISRAKALLIIVGNSHLLSTDIYWRSIIKYCVDNESYCGCDLPGVQ